MLYAYDTPLSCKCDIAWLAALPSFVPLIITFVGISLHLTRGLSIVKRKKRDVNMFIELGTSSSK